MTTVHLTEQEKAKGIDLSGYNHWSASSLTPLVPRILAAGKVHAGEKTTAEIKSRIFFNTLRSAAEIIGYFHHSPHPRVAGDVPAADFLKVGRLIMQQVPADIRTRVDEKLQEGFRQARHHFTPGDRNSHTMEDRAQGFRSAIKSFGGSDPARPLHVFAGFTGKHAHDLHEGMGIDGAEVIHVPGVSATGDTGHASSAAH